MSASANNARSSAMPPPSANGTRKTLAERAGEVPKSTQVTSNLRIASTAVRGVPLAGTSRQQSFSSSTSSMRPPSVNSSRNVSNGSFTSSVSSSSRPPSQVYRPQTAMGNSKLQKPVANHVRPSTAMETHNSEFGPRKRKGMTPFPLHSDGAPKTPAQMQSNGSRDPSTKYSSGWKSIPDIARSIRDFSLNTAMSQLSLNEPAPTIASQVKPETPSQIPRLAQSNAPQPEITSPSKSPKKAPQRLHFLTRESNTPVALDTDSRIEELFCQFKETMNGATTESNSLKDMVNLYKERSKLEYPSTFITELLTIAPKSPRA